MRQTEGNKSLRSHQRKPRTKTHVIEMMCLIYNHARYMFQILIQSSSLRGFKIHSWMTTYLKK